MTAPLHTLDVRAFGAVGDGQSDDTAAIATAIRTAPEKGGVIFFPPGHYRSDVIRAPSHTTFLGHAAWSYSSPGGTVISPLHENQPCLFDAMGSQGTRWVGLAMNGLRLGREIHGIMTGREAGEQNIVIDDCQVSRFSGSGVHLRAGHVWMVRHSMLAGNGVDGIDAEGCDGWILDNQIVINGRAGIRGGLASVQITGNRLEHNGRAGILAGPAWIANLQIIGNSFCSNVGPGIDLSGEEALRTGGRMATPNMVISGNHFRFNASHQEEIPSTDDPALDCHLRLRHLCGVSVTGNTLYTWRGPKEERRHPRYGMIIAHLRDAVIAENAMYQAAFRELIHDEGGHANLIVRENAGCLEKDGIPRGGMLSTGTLSAKDNP